MDKQQSLETEKRQTRANGSKKHENMGEIPRAQSKLEVKQTAEDNEKVRLHLLHFSVYDFTLWEMI